MRHSLSWTVNRLRHRQVRRCGRNDLTGHTAPDDNSTLVMWNYDSKCWGPSQIYHSFLPIPHFTPPLFAHLTLVELIFPTPHLNKLLCCCLFNLCCDSTSGEIATKKSRTQPDFHIILPFSSFILALFPPPINWGHISRNHIGVGECQLILVELDCCTFSSYRQRKPNHF